MLGAVFQVPCYCIMQLGSCSRSQISQTAYKMCSIFVYYSSCIAVVRDDLTICHIRQPLFIVIYVFIEVVISVIQMLKIVILAGYKTCSFVYCVPQFAVLTISQIYLSLLLFIYLFIY